MEPSANPNPVPDLIPSTLTTKIISTAGENGFDGSVYPAGHRTAGYGQNGSDGQDAAPPTEGGSGRDIEIQLSFDPDRPGYIEVLSGEHDEFELSSSELLFLDTHGGNGGNGGCGENGQHGGPGYDGADATRYSNGQNGGHGGSGGKGGSGTSGADGGHGGNTFTRVHDDELDLLLAVDYKVHGGTGGDPGTHGVPGMGGPGGRGGKKWRRPPFSDIQPPSRPGGLPGLHGPGGLRPSTILSPGLSGEDGRTCINVVREDIVTSYPRRYHMVVESFEVVDENNDGINEPGEHLIVTNIIVRNDGPMPSPSGQAIKVVIRSSTWLEPDTTAPLILPDSISPNGRVAIPGRLRALIRHERTSRKSGEILNARDTVSLLGYSERLHRSIPEFSGNIPIIVQYPLQLARPVYMDCMEKCDEMTISWMVNNVSTATYGHSRSRATTTKLIDSRRNFVLQSAEGELNYVQDDVDKLKPATGSAFGETIMVADDTRPFSTGSLILELNLSDPHSGAMRRIMHHEINIQISEGYGFNSTSQFLLVVNASTDNKAITQMQQFIRTRIFLEVDTLNLSLTGSLSDEESNRSALLRYKGKSIIITGNSFTYFSRFKRYNWDLIDPQVARMLLMSRTSFLFCGMCSENAQESLKKWTSLMRYPADLTVEGTDSLVGHNNRKTLLREIRTRPSLDFLSLNLKDQYMPSGKSTIFWTIEGNVQRKGKTLSRKLAKLVPMRRFLVTSEEPSAGIISVIEGLSRSSNCMGSRLPIVDADGVITHHQVVMMIASIPFHTLAVVFWNMIQSLSSSGITPDIMYRNLPGFYTHRDLTASYDDGGEGYEEGCGRLISHAVCRAVAWAVEHALDSDIQQLCDRNPRLPDGITKKSILTHTPRLRTFLNEIPNYSVTVPKQGIELAVQVVGSLNAAVRSSYTIIDVLSSIPGLRTHRANLRRNIAKYNRDILEFMAHKTARHDIKNDIANEKKKLVRERQRDPENRRTSQNTICRKLKALTGDSSTGFMDITAAEEGSIYMSPSDFEAHRTAHEQLLNQQRDDVSYAKETREETITRVFETLDFIPVTNFR